jgi:hypothetical protein
VKRIILALLTFFILPACDMLGKLENPTGPSTYMGNETITELTSWYPCVIVHTPGYSGSPEMERQFETIAKLQKAGRMNWIRLGSPNRDYYRRAMAMGLKVFNILDINELEESRSWQVAFEQAYLEQPSNMWEIGGEISNPAIHTKLMSPWEYMDKFKELYAFVRQRYPQVTLVSAPTFGSATTKRNPVGPIEFERFIELGLLDMDVIIAINVYTEDALQQYAAIFSHHRAKLARKRIWITETGIDNPSKQVGWVQNYYPKIINAFHPEMICWYALWVGDQPGGEHDYGLIDKILTPEMVEGDLFRALTGGRE